MAEYLRAAGGQIRRKCCNRRELCDKWGFPAILDGTDHTDQPFRGHLSTVCPPGVGQAMLTALLPGSAPYVLPMYSLCIPYVFPMYSLCTPYALAIAPEVDPMAAQVSFCKFL